MSQTLNKIILIGYFGGDPESRSLPGDQDKIVVNVSLATTERWKDKATQEDKEETEWHSLVLYNQQARFVRDHLKKGAKVYVEGRVKTRKWDDDKGVTHYKTEVLVSDLRTV